jgi:hypothetical protein
MSSSINSQLFRKKPTIEFVSKVSSLYNIKEFNTSQKFTLSNLKNLNTVEKLNNMLPELKEYYINCKAKIYLENLDPKKAVTVLRQLLKSINYNLISKEKYANGKKFLEYKVDQIKNKPKVKKKIIVTFD